MRPDRLAIAAGFTFVAGYLGRFGLTALALQFLALAFLACGSIWMITQAAMYCRAFLMMGMPAGK